MGVSGANRQIQFNDLRNLAHEQMRRGEFTSAKSVLADMLSLEPHSLEALCDLGACYYNTYQFDEFRALTEKAYLLLSKFGVLPFEKKRTVSVVLKLGKALEELGSLDKAIKIFKTSYEVLSEEDQLKHLKILSQKLRLACDLDQRSEVLNFYQQLESIPVKGNDSDVDRIHALIKADGILVGPTMAIQRCSYVLENYEYLPEEHKQWISFDLIFDLLRMDRAIPSLDKILLRFSYDSVGPFEKMVWDIYLAFRNKDENAVFDTAKLVGLNVMSAIKIVDTVLALNLYPLQRIEFNNKLRMLISGLSQESRKSILTLLKMAKELFSENNLDINLTKNESLILESFQTAQSDSIDLEKICRLLYEGSADLHAIGRLKVSLSRLNKKLFAKTGEAQTFGFRNGSLVLLHKSALTGRKIS